MLKLLVVKILFEHVSAQRNSEAIRIRSFYWNSVTFDEEVRECYFHT